MDKTVIIVSAVVGSLGVLSAVLGFVAEGANLYNQSPALGIVASLFLLAAQITVSAVGGCYGCCSPSGRTIPSETNRIVGIVCAVVSWILVVIAVSLFFRGASLNSMGYYLSGLYAGGGVLALIATALAITSFIMLRNNPAGDVEVVTVSASNTPNTHQSPMAFLVGQPHLRPPHEAANAPSMPDVQPVPAFVMGHPMSSPGAVASAENDQDYFKQPPLPLPHTAGITSQPQVPHPQVSLAPLPQGINPQNQQTGIGNQILKNGVEFGVDLAVEMAGNALISMATDAVVGGDTEATGSGDASYQYA